MTKIDSPAVTSSTPQPRPKRWVEVPEKDIFEFTFPTIRINIHAYGPGRHYVEADVADEIEDRLQARMKHDLRVMQRNPDMVTQNTMNRLGVARGMGQASRNPEADLVG
jgi:hypothetical protein